MNLNVFSTSGSRRAGFTLIEVMISIFLALLLIIGINQAFRVVSATVGAGQAMATATRDSFSAQMAFQREMGQSLSHDNDTPYLIIDSSAKAAFLNKADMDSDRDGNPVTIDLTNSNVESTSYPWYVQNNRIHRIDCLGFFAADQYRRQTGNSADNTAVPETDTLTNPREQYLDAPGSFAAQQSSRYAYVWFGHLWLPTSQSATGQWNWTVNANGLPSYPGEGTYSTNPSNFLSTDWILGRMAILLVPGYKQTQVSLDTPLKWDGPASGLNGQPGWHTLEPQSVGGTKPKLAQADRPAPPPVDEFFSRDAIGATEFHLLTSIDRPPFIAPPVPAENDNKNDTSKLRSYLPLARYYKLAADSTGRIFSYQNLAAAPAGWNACAWDAQRSYNSVEDGRYDVAVGDLRTFRSIIADSIQRGMDYNIGANNLYNWRWWESLMYRFKATPKVTIPLDPDGVATSQQVFLRHCTQFIVEYAGDFVKQDNDLWTPREDGKTYDLNHNYGNVIDVYFSNSTEPTDGIIDYYIDKTADTSNANPNLKNQPERWIRRIRWYGFPRDINGDGKVPGYREQNTQNGLIGNNEILDVVPLRDIMMTGYTPNANNQRWGVGLAMPVITGADGNTYPAVTWSGAPFEKDMEGFDNNDGLHPGYLRSNGRQGNSGDYANQLSAASRYICAFGPTGTYQNNYGGGKLVYTPDATTQTRNPMVVDNGMTHIKMLRITYTLDDPNNRLAEGQTFQYVITLP